LEPAEYKKMYEAEDAHWWYRGVRLYLQKFVGPSAGADARLLDAGCGTGGNLAVMSRGFGRACGVDLSEEAVRLCAHRGLADVAVGDLNALPFPDGTFDCVMSCDVFECSEVSVEDSMRELVRVTRRGGRIVLTVAAFQFLLGEHDRAVHSVRRFTKSSARRVLGRADIEILSMRYLFGILFPLIAGYRLVRKFIATDRFRDRPRSDVFLPHSFLNRLLYTVVRMESFLADVVRFPAGSTLLVEMRRL
jgi:SAM-dependent methyltransferase